MSCKLLTIIIPTYNMEKYLDQCLSSLVCNKDCMNKMEILVINDGSTDSSSIIAHHYESLYPQTFKIIDKDNGNYGSCINVGLEYATGKYIKILDADDYYCTPNIQSFVLYLENNDYDLIISNYQSVDDSGSITNKIIYNNIHSLIDFFKPGVPYLQMHAITYRTYILKKINYHQTEHLSYTDQEWTFTPIIAVNTIGYYDNILYNYRVGRADQTMNPQKYKRDFWQDIKVVENIVLQYNQTDKTKLNKSQNEYLNRRLYERINNIYYNYFKIFRLNYDNNELKKFDQYIKNNIPEIYDKFEQTQWNEGRFLYNYQYIKKWRNNNCKPTLLLRLIRIYSSLRKMAL